MHWFRILLALPLLLLLGGWLTVSALRAIRRGEANAAGTRVRWRERRFFFILTVLVQFAFGALILWQAGLILLSIIQGN
jgi:hypothetical protein